MLEFAHEFLMHFLNIDIFEEIGIEPLCIIKTTNKA